MVFVIHNVAVEHVLTLMGSKLDQHSYLRVIIARLDVKEHGIFWTLLIWERRIAIAIKDAEFY